MRGIVMEINKNGLIIMTNDGQFLKIQNYKQPLEIGQEIETENIRKQNFEIYRKMASIAAAIILFFTGGYGVLANYMVYGYVDVDINPSVELSYNLYKRVISAKGLNGAGENILLDIEDYKNKPIQEVVNKVIDRAIEEEYIKVNEKNTVLITITEKGSSVDENVVLNGTESHIKNSPIETEVVVIKGNQKNYEDAKINNISPGKLNLIEKAKSVDQQISPEEIKDKSVKEIMNIINKAKEESKEQEKISKESEKATKEQMKKQDKIKKENEKKIKEQEKQNKKNKKELEKQEKNDAKKDKDNSKDNKNINKLEQNQKKENINKKQKNDEKEIKNKGKEIKSKEKNTKRENKNSK